jgi:autoinducer 2-degrading protein
MYVVCVTVFVKQGKIEDFKEAIYENARNTYKEPDNIRFDVLQAENDSSQFFLYEVYKSPEGFKSHQKTEHYLKWKEKVADWMAQPRQGVKHYSLFPADSDW